MSFLFFQIPRKKSEVLTKLWEYSLGTSYSYDLDVDSEGNCYVAYSRFLRKLNSSGLSQWLYTSPADYNYSSKVDNDFNIYCALSSLILVKLNPSGEFIWDYTNSHLPISITLDIAKTNALLGDYGGNLKRISSEGSLVRTYSPGNSNVYCQLEDSSGNIYIGTSYRKLAKMASDGTEIWDYSQNGTPRCIVKDSEDNLYVGNDTNKVAKINPSGTKIWELDCGAKVYTIDIDSKRNTYAGDSSGKITKIDSSGNKIWEYIIGNEAIYGLKLYGDGILYISAKRVIKFKIN